MQTLKSPADILVSDDWSNDNAAGRELADAYLAQARSENNPSPIAAVLRRMASAGRWSGVEVGFAFALAGAAVS